MTFGTVCKIGDRDVNQDCVEAVRRGNDYCFVVADGLGAHGKGELASRLLVDAFVSEFELELEGSGAFLSEAFDSAQAAILQSQQNANEMKTTAVALSIIGGRFSWGHIGDSRLYHFRKAKLRKRTMDHSVPQMLVFSGEISDGDIRSHPDRNKLLRAMGDDWDDPLYELSKEKKLSKGDAFLLCSDGFWEFISDDEMINALKTASDAEEWLAQMLSIVEAAGVGHSMDNYSAITVVYNA